MKTTSLLLQHFMFQYFRFIFDTLLHHAKKPKHEKTYTLFDNFHSSANHRSK